MPFFDSLFKSCSPLPTALCEFSQGASGCPLFQWGRGTKEEGAKRLGTGSPSSSSTLYHAGCITPLMIIDSLEGPSPYEFHTAHWRLQESPPPSSFKVPKGSPYMKLLLAPTQCTISGGLCTLPRLWQAILLLDAITMKQIESTICFPL